MKAARLVAYGDAVEGIALHDLPNPHAPGPDEVLVAVRYAPINVSDLMVARGIYDWKPDLPEILGNEGSGVVLSVGERVRGLVPGAKVVLPFMVRSWRERLLVPAEALLPLPQDTDLQQAAMATINAVSADMMLRDFVDLGPGDGVLYNAATSGLGHWVAGLAARRGLRTVGLVRNPADIRRVRASGCEIVLLDADGIGVDPPLAELDIRLALDGVGGASAGRLAGLLGVGGTLVAYGAASGEAMSISAQRLIFRRISVRGFFEGHPENRRRIMPVLGELAGLLGPDGIRQPVAGVYPLDAIRKAVAHAVRGGKVLLAVGESGGP